MEKSKHPCPPKRNNKKGAEKNSTGMRKRIKQMKFELWCETPAVLYALSLFLFVFVFPLHSVSIMGGITTQPDKIMMTMMAMMKFPST